MQREETLRRYIWQKKTTNVFPYYFEHSVRHRRVAMNISSRLYYSGKENRPMTASGRHIAMRMSPYKSTHTTRWYWLCLRDWEASLCSWKNKQTKKRSQMRYQLKWMITHQRLKWMRRQRRVASSGWHYFSQKCAAAAHVDFTLKMRRHQEHG